MMRCGLMLMAGVMFAGMLAGRLNAAPKEKLSSEERLTLVRGITAEYATTKVMMPKSKRALPVNEAGRAARQDVWDKATREQGPSVKPGDSVQITRIDVNGDNIVMDINGGMKSGGKWYDHVQVGIGNTTAPVSRGNPMSEGTTLVVEFRDGVPSMTPAEFKKLLAPIMDFDKRSATEDYLENLPEPIRLAIKEKRAVEGMKREQVLEAVGHPRHKTRESKDGVEAEDWVYGMPPGKITFVTFEGDVVVKVSDTYAGLGGSTAPRLDPN